MAKTLQQEARWFLNKDNLDMRALDVQALSTGDIGVAFGGSSRASGVIYSGLVNLAKGKLGAISENLLPGDSSSGVPVTTVRDIELDAGKPGKMVATIHMANSAVGADGNFALLTQVYNGSKPLAAPSAVNPGTAADITTDNFVTLTRADGSYVSFFTDYPGGSNLSQGIQMSSFKADGSIIGSPKTVIAEKIVLPALGLENNPEMPSATFMDNGNIGLIYKENTDTGASKVTFQEITVKGKHVGAEVELQSTGAVLPQIVTLAGGKLLAVWQSVDGVGVSTLKAQLLTAKGNVIGSAFDVAATSLGTQTAADAVALADGGFAVTWLNGFNHPVGRIFDPSG